MEGDFADEVGTGADSVKKAVIALEGGLIQSTLAMDYEDYAIAGAYYTIGNGRTNVITTIERAAPMGTWAFVPAAGGVCIGFFLLMWLDRCLPEPQFLPGGGTKSGMMTLAVTLHNIPEGMAVGAAFAGALSGHAALASAFALAAGIAIQNIPEGAIISMPLAAGGMKKGRAFAVGVGTGAVEPAGAALMLLLTGWLTPLLPWCLAFAAGAMLYVVAEQLLPDVGDRRSLWGVAAFALGFVLMMSLDVALG